MQISYAIQMFENFLYSFRCSSVFIFTNSGFRF